MAISAGLSSVGTNLISVPCNDLISFKRFVTNTGTGLVDCNHCRAHYESVHSTFEIPVRQISFSTNLRHLITIRIPNNSSLGMVISSEASLVLEKSDLLLSKTLRIKSLQHMPLMMHR